MINTQASAVQPPWFELPQSERIKPLGENHSPCHGPDVIVVGSGLAGCHTAHELATRGVDVLLLDAAEQVASGASGNSAGIVKPFVTRKPAQTDVFYQYAFEYLLQQLDNNPSLHNAAQFNQCGVLQLLEHGYPENAHYQACTAKQASDIAGTSIHSNAIYFARGGWLNPGALCEALVQHPNIKLQLNTRLKNFSATNNGWSIVADAQTTTSTTELNTPTLILANGHNINQFKQTAPLPITPARGQCSTFDLPDASSLNTVVTGKRYAIPGKRTVIAGASFERNSTAIELKEHDHQQNRLALGTLLPTLTLNETEPSGFCAVRATLPDRLPVLGAVPDFVHYAHSYELLKNGLPENRFPSARYQPGLYVIGGFGSRGIVSAPYCAKLLADHLCGLTEKTDTHYSVPAPDLASWSALLHPARFTIRALRKAR